MSHSTKAPHYLKQLGSLCLTVLAVTALSASHHFETELSQKYPAFDVTDAFVFESARPGFTTFIMHVNPSANPDAEEIFGGNGLYNLHIAFDDTFTTGVTYTVKFTGQRFELGKIDEPNADVGQQGNKIGASSLGQTVTFDNGIKIWAGLARDPFMGNAVGITTFKQRLNEGMFDVHAFDNAEDFFADKMEGSIVLEVPNQMLSEDVHYFVTTAMKLDDGWKQINRAANVLMTHLFFGNNTPEIHEHIHHRPDTDTDRKYAISNRVLRTVSLAKTKDDPVGYADKVANILMPDVLSYRVGTPAKYGIQERNGRKLSDDAMDAVLSIFSGTNVTDHANTSDRYQAAFPYVVPVSK